MIDQKKTINVCTWNLCLGLQYKLRYVEEILIKEDIDVLCLQETELEKGLDMTVLNIKGYDLETDSAADTIRTSVYIKSTLNYERIQNQHLNQNLIILKITEKICLIYSFLQSTDHGRTLVDCLKKVPLKIK